MGSVLLGRVAVRSRPELAVSVRWEAALAVARSVDCAVGLSRARVVRVAVLPTWQPELVLVLVLVAALVVVLVVRRVYRQELARREQAALTTTWISSR